METKEIMPDAARDSSDLEVHWNLALPVRRILNGKRTLLISTAAGFLLSLSVVLVWKPYYTAEAVFLPPKSDFSTSGASPMVLFGANESSDTYLGMLSSRTVADEVIDKLGLVSKFHVRDQSIARSILAGSSKFSVDKNTLISVQVNAGTRQLASDIANAYLDALYDLNGQMVTSASAHRRMFFDQQLQEQKKELSEAEVDLKATQERTGIVLPAGEAQAGIAASAQLQSEINAAETRLAGLLVADTEKNPEVIQLRTQIDQLRSQLARQQASTTPNGTRAGLTPQGRLPEFTLEYAQKQHEVQLRQAVYDALVQQDEKARLASLDPGPQLQVIDRAISPDRKSGPPRKMIVLAGIAIGFIFGVLFILTADLMRNFIAAVRTSDSAESR
jgi:tyrosine-protein kinase Etk/Wzc